ncbi:unnamed protein product [Amoebophrya sp. A25]|nr:unnamed protein product [Amoebophrya sp. A25]|eukprot:GSA25T00000256001.1
MAAAFEIIEKPVNGVPVAGPQGAVGGMPPLQIVHAPMQAPAIGVVAGTGAASASSQYQAPQPLDWRDSTYAGSSTPQERTHELAQQYPHLPASMLPPTSPNQPVELSLYSQGVTTVQPRMVGVPGAVYEPGPGAMDAPPDRTIYGENKWARYLIWGLLGGSLLLILIAFIVGATAGWRSTGFIVLITSGSLLFSVVLIGVCMGLG